VAFVAPAFRRAFARFKNAHLKVGATLAGKNIAAVPACQSEDVVSRCLGLRLSPDFARGIHHKLKFLPLLVHR
jgi:hypothetical protein